MMNNPFTPIFGGKPDFFFGRKTILSSFESALTNRGSEFRTLFITGTRGYGKTALLEQLSMLALKHGWKTIDVSSERTIESIIRQLTDHDESTKTLSPELEVSILGSGGKLAGLSTSKTTRYSTADLQHLLLSTCEKEKQGVFLSIDEIQKVDIEEISALCSAFQMASRKGFDVILSMAGLPYAHDRVIHHEGCTYVRRAFHQKLGPLSASEVREGLREGFDKVSGFRIGDAVLEVLTTNSKGHPYIMQLLGYYAVEHMNARKAGFEVDAEAVVALALNAYSDRAIKPIMETLPESEIAYLKAMSKVVDDSRVIKTSAVSQALGKTQQQTSRQRKKLLDEGLVISAGRGELIFGIPYVDTYFQTATPVNSEVEERLPWRY